MAHEEARRDRSAVVDGEFKELATSVRKWLVLSGSKALSKTAISKTAAAAERPDVRVSHETGRAPASLDHEDAVAAERPALLIDAECVSSDRLPHVMEAVRAAYGRPLICRAYADWTKPELRAWFAQLRHLGIQPMQNFDTPDHSRSLVALAVDALDLVDHYAVTCAVLVGDLGAALPLVTRLKATGVKVAVIGPASNPDDVRRAVDEFVDIASLRETARRTGGRHRA
ncbi:MAG: NYN domain-containing protein [Nocardioides sp.]|uniref:NYN domain-containing protein n=1 Tax=Nocardioides sp. TaxID=35761 RepID=UPI0032656BAE